jgi:hypothetical protein
MPTLHITRSSFTIVLASVFQASLGVKPRTTDNDEPQMSFAHSTPIRDKQAAYSSPQLQSQQHSQQQLQNQHQLPNAPIVSTSMRKLDDLLSKVQRDKEVRPASQCLHHNSDNSRRFYTG